MPIRKKFSIRKKKKARRPRPRNRSARRRRFSALLTGNTLDPDDRRVSFLWVFIFIIVLIGAAYFFFFSSYYRINEIIIRGTDETKETEIRSILERSTSGRWALFLRKDNLIIFNAPEAKTAILDKMVQLKDVRIEKHFPASIEITVEENPPAAIWQSPFGFYYIDQAGSTTIKTSEEEARSKDLAIITNPNLNPIEEHQQVTTRKMLDFISTARAEIAARADFKIALVYLPEIEFLEEENDQESTATSDNPNSDSESSPTPEEPINQQLVPSRAIPEINFRTSEGWDIFFDIDTDPVQAVDTLFTVLQENVTNRQALRYIDLRIPEKVFIR